ncbi:MAG: hypothetical protein D6735_14310 [Acidobacteria bacterium]|nr:MAG: hypothetical protein D6735_14310 [Acidobacteriota bacterium]
MKKAKRILPTIGDKKKIEVSVETDQVIIKFLTWAEVLGWQCQKTIRIDADMMPDFQRALLVAARQLNADSANNEKPEIIPFPLVRDQEKF